jgi:hypothetical protein
MLRPLKMRNAIDIVGENIGCRDEYAHDPGRDEQRQFSHDFPASDAFFDVYMKAMTQQNR